MPFSSNMKTSLKSVRAGCCLLVSIQPPLMHGSTRPSSRPSERLWKSRSFLANPDVVWLIQMNNNITKYNWFFHVYEHVNSWHQIKIVLHAVNAYLLWCKALLYGTVCWWAYCLSSCMDQYSHQVGYQRGSGNPEAVLQIQKLFVNSWHQIKIVLYAVNAYLLLYKAFLLWAYCLPSCVAQHSHQVGYQGGSGNPEAVL